MPINIQSNIDYKKVCEELGISLDDLVSIVNQKGNIKEINSIKYTTIEVIDAFIEQLNIQKDIYSANTLNYYFSFLFRYREFLLSTNNINYINDLNEDLIMNFLVYKNISSKGTINTYKAIIRKLLCFAYEHQYLERDIRYKFKKHKYHLLPKYFSEDQVSSILELTLNRTNGYRWRAIFITLLGTGLRVSELVNLKVKDISFENQLIFTIGKGNKERYIPLFPEVKKALLHYFNLIGLDIIEENSNCYLFSKDYNTSRLKPISIRSVQYNLQQILQKLEYNNRLTVHSFRHTFAVNCLRAGMKLEYLSQILGHEDPKTTSIYTKLFPSDLRDEVISKYPIPFEKLIKEIMQE
ncbi:tyrosine-type recombinase/integrase [Guptibacillus spartinae]|uniref:tyrosine-type recombinase/integrase n=1 Tax=Guptibacillus spartinae TaxID=3025679 RepID=UPI00235F6AAF|nr:tyrosine-type recombinase/integrase [Pseudalkalibacillus spartinae]